MASLEEFRDMVQEFKKPAGERCRYQRHGKGCMVYKTRPFPCRMWSCRWLVEDDTQGLSRPDHSHYVIDIMPDKITIVLGGERRDMPVIQVWVDPKYPDAHRDPHLRAYMERRGAEGCATMIRYDSSDALIVFPPNLSEDGQWYERDSRLAVEGETS